MLLVCYALGGNYFSTEAGRLKIITGFEMFISTKDLKKVLIHENGNADEEQALR